MSIDKEMQDAINEQINAEIYSAYLYLSMSSWFEDRNLVGFSNWMRCQYLEESMHAMKLYNFVNERGGRVLLKPIAGPETDWESYDSVFVQVAEHEAHVTKLINNLVAIARKLNDYASESFLMWYVDEQVEEEATADEILTRLRMIKGDNNALYTLDTELKTRAPALAVLPTILGQPVA
ncbi:MAG: ferritin [Bacteroidetes bacterium]|nr:ferritin [Bacteroidota bacterium]